MSRKKKPEYDEYNVDVRVNSKPEDHVLSADSVAHQFIIQEDLDKPEPIPRLSEDELRRRELQRRFKRVRGYKPTEKNLDKLETLVEEAEQVAQKRNGIL